MGNWLSTEAEVTPQKQPDNLFEAYLAKGVLIGENGVGKTWLSLRYASDFDGNDTSMAAASFFTKYEGAGHINFKFQIWDPSGPERFSCLAPMYYRGLAFALILFKAEPGWEKHILHWKSDAEAKSPPGSSIFLVCTQVDLRPELLLEDTWKFAREILYSQKNPRPFNCERWDPGVLWVSLPREIVWKILSFLGDIGKEPRKYQLIEKAREFGFPLYFTSSKTGYGVKELFKEVAVALRKRLDAREDNGSIRQEGTSR